jgi:hypothetical protein
MRAGELDNTPSVDANKFRDTGRTGLDGRQKVWNQGPQISKSVRPSSKHNDGDREAIQVLLKGEVSINGDKYDEVLRRQGQQRSILDCCPTHLTTCLNIVTDNIARETPIDAFVEKHSHDAASMTRSFASSRKAMT